MSNIITNRKFILKSPEEILNEKINDIINENEDLSGPKFMFSNNRKLVISEKKEIVKNIEKEPKKKKFFIPKFYI